MPDVLRSGKGYEVRTEGDLETVLQTVAQQKKEYAIVNVHLDPYDRSVAMERLGRRLGEHV